MPWRCNIQKYKPNWTWSNICKNRMFYLQKWFAHTFIVFSRRITILYECFPRFFSILTSPTPRSFHSGLVSCRPITYRNNFALLQKKTIQKLTKLSFDTWNNFYFFPFLQFNHFFLIFFQSFHINFSQSHNRFKVDIWRRRFIVGLL